MGKFTKKTVALTKLGVVLREWVVGTLDLTPKKFHKFQTVLGGSSPHLVNV